MADQEASTGRVLEQRIQAALAQRQNQTALELLRELARAEPGEAEIQHRLGVLEEQLGSPQAALRAHLRSVELAPRNVIAHVYAGYALQQLGRPDEALALWSLGADLDPTLFLGSQRRDPTGLRRNVAAAALRRHFSNLHRHAAGEESSVARIREAFWVQTSDVAFRFARAEQKPHLFYVPGLPARPWYEPASWEWSQPLENHTDEILEEFLANQGILDEHGRPYLGKGLQLGAEFSALQGSLNWTALDLYRDGQLQQHAARAFPRTLEALAALPLYGLGENPFEVFFSLLKPGQHIVPHYGLSNHSLTVHLPIIAPADCSVTVGGETRETRRGQLLAFDDSYRHEARNSSDSPRVVLIFSVWHPDLTDAERAAIQRSFESRSDWLRSRRVPPGE